MITKILLLINIFRYTTSLSILFTKVIKFCQTTAFMILYEKYNYQIIHFKIHVTPFLTRVNVSKYFCSFKVDFNNAIYDAYKLHLTL